MTGEAAVTGAVNGMVTSIGSDRICEAVVPKRPAATPVLVKPNLCGFDAMKDPATHGGDDGVRGRTTSVDFTRGVVDTRAVIFYCSATFLFLFLTLRVVESRRWK